MRAHTDAVAQPLTQFLKSTDRTAKTIVWCVDKEHASEMRQALPVMQSKVFEDSNSIKA